ncbi:MAG: hypothetical protein SF123_26630 [Chloroflexota bacterium]|nr:hypothetical protein [Chloroflexota bacterium]
MTTLPESTPRTPRDHSGMLLASLVLAVLSWLGLYQLVTTERPLVGPRFIFFLLLMVAVACTVIPFVRYLNVRFTPVHRPLPSSGVIVRQGVWVGLFVVMCAWLQIPRVLTLPIALFLAMALVVVEIFLRSRELAHEREVG